MVAEILAGDPGASCHGLGTARPNRPTEARAPASDFANSLRELVAGTGGYWLGRREENRFLIVPALKRASGGLNHQCDASDATLTGELLASEQGEADETRTKQRSDCRDGISIRLQLFTEPIEGVGRCHCADAVAISE